MRGGGVLDLTVFLRSKGVCVGGGGGGRYSHVFLHVDLDQASTVYHKKISEVSGIPQKLIES